MFPTVREGRWRIKARATIISPGTLSLSLSLSLFFSFYLEKKEKGEEEALYCLSLASSSFLHKSSALTYLLQRTDLRGRAPRVNGRPEVYGVC